MIVIVVSEPASLLLETGVLDGIHVVDMPKDKFDRNIWHSGTTLLLVVKFSSFHEYIQENLDHGF